MRLYLGKSFRWDRDPLALFPIFRGMPHRFLLLSSAPDPDKGRYSFLGADPFLIFESRGTRIEVQPRNGSPEVYQGDPLAHLKRLLGNCTISPLPGIPFAGGAVGFLAYSWKWQALRRMPVPPGPVEPPDIRFGFYDRAVIIDHQESRMFPVATGLPAADPVAREKQARGDLARLEEALARPLPVTAFGNPPPIRFRPQVGLKDYRILVRQAQEHIARGDIYQVNLTYRLDHPGSVNPFPAFAGMVRCNPTAFSAYLEAGDTRVLCTSPERFIRWDGMRAESRPIKGTRPRGSTPAEDLRRRRELLESPKERAENVMIVDLIRNDLGRVCRPGSVVVRNLADLETYSRVHHLVSTVEGTLSPSADRFDLIRSLFPGGSMTGAPKIRAMEILDRLEPASRGIYSGSLGYLSFSGEMDLNIVIRTVIQDRTGTHFHVGGAILAESDADREYEETLAKADSIFQALSGGRLRRIRVRGVEARPAG